MLLLTVRCDCSPSLAHCHTPVATPTYPLDKLQIHEPQVHRWTEHEAAAKHPFDCFCIATCHFSFHVAAPYRNLRSTAGRCGFTCK